MKTTQSQFDYISEISSGYWKSQVLMVAVGMGIFSLLHCKGGVSALSVSRSIKADRRATVMLLDALVGLKFLSKRGGVYRNSPMSDKFLVAGRPLYQGDRICLSRNLWDNWTLLGRSVKTGRAVAFINAGKKVDQKRRKVFISAMRDFAVLKSRQLAGKLDLADKKLLLDLGGGPGSYAIEFVKANAGLHAVVFDLKGVTKITGRFIRDAGLDGRITTVDGECVGDDYGREAYDVVFVSNLLHMYDEDINRNILVKCKDALQKGGMVVVHDFMLDSSMTHPPFAALFSLNMLTGTHGGRNYSKKEITGWLREAGFRKLKCIDLEPDSSVVMGVK